MNLQIHKNNIKYVKNIKFIDVIIICNTLSLKHYILYLRDKLNNIINC